MDAPVVILLAAVALLVRVGMAWYATGLSRSKNAAAAVVRNVLDFCVATLAFWVIGAAVFVGDVGLIADYAGRANSATFLNLVLVLFASAVPIGAAGERSKLLPLGALSFVMAAFVIPVAAHWSWTGWLHRMGYHDAAGSGVIHVAAGASALAVAILVGGRTGKYNRDGSSNMIPGHSLPLASVGVVLMLVAWLPYVVAASAAHGGVGGRTAMNVLLAAAGGGLTAFVFSMIRYGKPDVLLTYSGLLGALVGVTGGANMMPTGAAVVLGAVTGVLVPYAMVQIDLRFKIDDPTGAVAVHGLGGLLGTLAAGLFKARSASEAARQVGIQALGALAIAALALLATAAVLVVLRAVVGIRSKEADEFDGLDLAEHDLNAYPDFQQTTIKSYHLREA